MGDNVGEILLYLSNGFILLGFLLYVILILANRKSKFSDSDGFNVTKDTLSEYGSINIIENKSLFTIYNLRRKVIKIASKCYYGNSLSNISIPLVEAGISATDDNGNKFIDIFRKLFSNLKKAYILPLILIIVNSVTYSLGDARIVIFLIAFCSIISYMIIDIKNNAYDWLDKSISKKLAKDKIMSFIKKIMLCDKLIFFGELIMIIRMVAIILDIG